MTWRIRCNIFHGPISIFCRCRHFSVGGASGRGAVDSRGQGMASKEFGPCPNSLAPTHQPGGGHTALFSVSEQGETKMDVFCCYCVALVFFLLPYAGLFPLVQVVMNDMPSCKKEMFAAVRSDWQRPFAQNTLVEWAHPSWHCMAHPKDICYSAGCAPPSYWDLPTTWPKKLWVSSSPQNTPSPNWIDLNCRKNYYPWNAEQPGILSVWDKKWICGLLIMKLKNLQNLIRSFHWSHDCSLMYMCWFFFSLLSRAISPLSYLHQGSLWSHCLNEEVLQLGLARTAPIVGLMPDSYLYWRLHKRLHRAEVRAERKGRGLWKQPSLWERVSEAVSDSAFFQLMRRTFKRTWCTKLQTPCQRSKKPKTKPWIYQDCGLFWYFFFIFQSQLSLLH